jgi:hypothetical protein
MPSEPELEPVSPCLLPVHNPSLEPEHYKGPGWGLRVDPCALCAVRGPIRHPRGRTLRSP